MAPASIDTTVVDGAYDRNPVDRLDYRFVVGVDIVSFSGLSAREQVNAQDTLKRVLDTASTRAGLDRKAWDRQVAGDGELAVLPRDADALSLIRCFPNELAKALTAANRNRRHPAARIRIRVAIHHGTLIRGSFGPVGKAPIVTARLLNSDVIRHELTLYWETDLAVIISASIYSDIVETRLGGLDPNDFHRAEVQAKGQLYLAYLYRGHLGRHSQPPSIAATVVSKERDDAHHR